MRTIRTKVYKFNELNETAQEKAIEKLYDINVYYEWWESIYEDAENIGLKITGFGIERGSYCDGDFIFDAENVAKTIISEHGTECETFKTASNFLKEYAPKCEVWWNSDESNYDIENELEELKENFLKSLLEDYRIMLQQEYEYQTSKEAIIETIEANEYEFTQDGRMI